MNATKFINTTTKFPSSHSDPNFHRSDLAFFVEVAATPLTFTKTTTTTITNSNNNCLSFQTTSGNDGSLASNHWQEATTSTSREYSRAVTPQSTTLTTITTKTAATMTLLDKEMSASDSEDTSKLMPAAIRFININNSNNNSNNNKCNSNNYSCSSHNNKNKSNGDNHERANSQTTTTTTISSDKLASSKFINSCNKLMTATTTHMRQQQQQQDEQTEQQRQKHNEKMLSITRDLNQINLKSSSLYANQQLHNDRGNNNSNNCRDQLQQQRHHEECDNLSTNVNSSNKINNKYNEKQQEQQQLGEEATTNYNNNSNSNNNNKDNNSANDNEHNNSDKLAQVNKMKMKSNNNNKNNKKSNNSNNESIEPAQQQQLVAAAKLNLQLEKIAVVSEKINSAATKVRVQTPTPTPTTATLKQLQAIERAKASKLTLRKSNSTPASFKIGDVASAAPATTAGKSISSNNNNDIKLFLNVSQSRVAETKANEELKNGNKSDSDAAGDGDGCGYDGIGGDGDGGGGEVSKCTAAIRVNFAPTLAHTRALKLTDTSFEAISTKKITQPVAATTTLNTTTTTTKLAAIKSATMDVVMRAPCVAHVSQQQLQQCQQQQQQQQPQQQQLTNTKSIKAKENDNQVICGIKCTAGVGTGVNDVVAVASTTTMPIASHTPLPLPAAVNFDLDLRFGCAHYKRRAMFVTPCCNKFYKCRFCHDENESHHFDRKTLTELICSECNTRQKVQEQCEACGTRFGKYTCLICNLFDDTDKKQYHCNGCGICRIGGAENFFHCEVCDMCLPIRLKIDGHRCVENISRSHCPVCLGDIHTSRIPCHIPDCGHLLHKTCFDQLLNSGHYTCPICQTSLIDMTALWEYLDAQAVSLPVPKKYENQRIHIFCNDCHKTSKTKFNFIGLKCMQCGAYNTTQDVKRRMSLVADEPSSA